PFWGDTWCGGDTFVTAFLLPFFTTLIASRIVRSQVRAGHVPSLAWGTSPLARLPRGLVGRGVVLGFVCILVVGVPTAYALGALGVSTMTFGGFIAFKALFAAVLSFVVTP